MESHAWLFTWVLESEVNVHACASTKHNYPSPQTLKTVLTVLILILLILWGRRDYACVNARTAFRSTFSSSTMWVPELRSSCLAIGTITQWAISLNPRQALRALSTHQNYKHGWECLSSSAGKVLAMTTRVPSPAYTWASPGQWDPVISEQVYPLASKCTCTWVPAHTWTCTYTPNF